MTDWREWHSKYDAPGSSLARRLEVVRRRIGESLVALAGRDEVRILGLCAGEGRDVLPELAQAAPAHRPAVLVEKDPTLAGRAGALAKQLGVANVFVVVGDAGRTATFSRWLPVDLLLLCGIFGNVPDDDIRATVASAAAMVRPGGRVIWTRGCMEPDLRPSVRRWFVDAGFVEVVFDGAPEPYGVGVGQMQGAGPPVGSLPEVLFAFQR